MEIIDHFHKKCDLKSLSWMSLFKPDPEPWSVEKQRLALILHVLVQDLGSTDKSI